MTNKFYFFLTITFLFSCDADKIKSAKTIEEVRSIYEQNTAIASDDFNRNVLEEKLTSLCKDDDCLKEISTWYKGANQYINVIIVPDLSNRLTKLENTKSHDFQIIDHIYNKFYDYASFVDGNHATVQKNTTFDRIMIDVSDQNQARGKFASYADAMSLDLGNAQGNNFETIRTHKAGIRNKINQLYDLGYKHNLEADAGADYYHYIQEEIVQKEKKNTVSKKYKNYLFIITDGYLEAPNGKYYTKGEAERSLFLTLLNSGKDETEALKESGLEIPKCREIDLSNWTIVILESREKKEGEIHALKSAWTNWFKNMGCKQIIFQPYTNQISITKDVINEAFKF